MPEAVTNTSSGDTGGGESQETGPLTTQQAQNDLDSWANEPVNPKPIPPRRPDGKFKKAAGDGDPREVNRVLKNTISQGLPKEEQPDESETEEEEPQLEEEAPKPRSRKVRAIVDGQEEEIDLSDDEFQKINATQAMRSAQKAWREAAQMRKETQEFRQMLDAAKNQIRQNPMALFQAMGIPQEDVLQFAQKATIDKLAETIDPMTGQPYSPEQQRIIQLQKQLEQKQQAEEMQRQQAEAAEMEKVKEVVRKDIDRKFTAALEETGLPTTQYTMMRLADLMQSMGPDVEPSQVAPLVLEDMVNEVRQTVYSMPVEVAAEVLGEEFLNELRKYDIEKARKGKDKFGRNPQKYPNNRPAQTPQRSNEKITREADAQDWLDKWASGGR